MHANFMINMQLYNSTTCSVSRGGNGYFHVQLAGTAEAGIGAAVAAAAASAGGDDAAAAAAGVAVADAILNAAAAMSSTSSSSSSTPPFAKGAFVMKRR
jgi:hypothetical protein